MTIPDPLDKIRKLLERAAHETTPVEEARTSAVIAAKLIVEYKVELSLPNSTGSMDDELQAKIDEIFSGFSAFVKNASRRREAPSTPPSWRPPMWSSPDSAPTRRQIYTAFCPPELILKCTCCGAPIQTGTRIAWTGLSGLMDRDTVAKVTHESCMRHWQQKRCTACKKNTNRNVREKLGDQLRDPPGTRRADQGGYCLCCTETFAIGDKIIQRGFDRVHVRCFPHFNKFPCPRCGSTNARF